MNRRIALSLFSLLSFSALLSSPTAVFAEKPNSVCDQSIPYIIGTIDDRFGISADELQQAMREAATYWNSVARKRLLTEGSVGNGRYDVITVDLVYDSRQAVVDKVKELLTIAVEQRSLMVQLESHLSQLKSQHAEEFRQLENAKQVYQQEKDKYEQEVADANANGGANGQQYAILQSWRLRLLAMADAIDSRREIINSLVQNHNMTASELNRMQHVNEITTAAIDAIAKLNGSEYQIGECTNQADSHYVKIFAFNNHDELVRILAHEFGHALGFAHTEGRRDIMHRTVTSDSLLSANDAAQVARRCGEKTSIIPQAAARIRY